MPEVRAASVYRKWWSVIDPPNAWLDTPRWIAFPWSAQGPVDRVDAED